MIDDAQYETNLDPLKFKRLLSDAEKPIYPNCTKFTKLSALLKLYNLKQDMNGMKISRQKVLPL